MATESREIVDTNGEIIKLEQQSGRPGGELVRRERRSEVLQPLDSEQLAQSFHAYQQLLPRLLADSDYQTAGRDRRTGQPRRFLTKSGWRKLATAFDLDVLIVADEVDRDDQGRAIRAKVIARAVAPSGRAMDGDGFCAITEERFASSNADLRRLENDLRATATTRAKNRAIADLIGMGAVSAEEISDHPVDTELPFGPEVDQASKREAAQACVILIGDDKEAGIELWTKIARELGGYMPKAAAIALIATARTMTTQSASTSTGATTT